MRASELCRSVESGGRVRLADGHTPEWQPTAVLRRDVPGAAADSLHPACTARAAAHAHPDGGRRCHAAAPEGEHMQRAVSEIAAAGAARVESAHVETADRHVSRYHCWRLLRARGVRWRLGGAGAVWRVQPPCGAAGGALGRDAAACRLADGEAEQVATSSRHVVTRYTLSTHRGASTVRAADSPTLVWHQ